jgi:hypothetical protein
MEEYQDVSVRHYEWFGWEGLEENKKAMDYTENDQQNKWKKEVKECQQGRRKEELQKTEEWIDKSRRKGQEEVSWKHMWKIIDFSRTRR